VLFSSPGILNMVFCSPELQMQCASFTTIIQTASLHHGRFTIYLKQHTKSTSYTCNEYKTYKISSESTSNITTVLMSNSSNSMNLTNKTYNKVNTRFINNEVASSQNRITNSSHIYAHIHYMGPLVCHKDSRMSNKS